MRVMIKEKQHIEKSSSSSSEGGVPSAGNDNQMIKTPDNNSGDIDHDLDCIIKTETDMTALIDNTGGDVADNKSCVGNGNTNSNVSPGSSNTDQKQQILSNDMCLSQIKHEDTGNNSGIKIEDNNTSTTTTTVESDFGGNATANKPSNTTSGNMDAQQQQQYMQQQSQIFVFSTSLANKSAESVISGQYSTIIAYHCAQPRTKKFLEKHPLKINQFNRQNPGQWMNNVVASQQQLKHQQQLNKSMAPHGGLPKYGSGTPYSRAMKNSSSATSLDNPVMQSPGARMPLWNHHQGNHINDSGPPQQQHLQHPSNHNMMGSLCGPGNNGLIGMPNHSSGPIGPGMLMNNSNSNSSMMGGPGSILNQPGNICSMGPGSGGGMSVNGMDLELMDHHSSHQHHPNPHHPSNMIDGSHRPMMGGGPHHPHHPPPHHPSGALHHRGSVGIGGGPPHHHGMSDMMAIGGGANKCRPSPMDGLMLSSGGPPRPPGSGDSPEGHNTLSAIIPSLDDFDDPIGSGSSSLGAAAAAAAAHHSLAGVQVPDENLTPQQRQHREEQQATLRKLQQMLFPENSNSGGGGPQQQHPPVTSSSSIGGGPLDNCSGSGMDDLMPSIDDDLDVDAVVTAAAATNSAADLLLPPKTPTSCSSDWQKSMFGNEDDKKKDVVRCGPPPSYHQTVARSASVPIVSVPSCSPNSPLAGGGTGVTNSNLSLPSPRTCSAMNSPAGGRPSSNMSPTAVRSPGGSGSRLQSSNPGTPVHMSPGSGTGHNSCSSIKQQKGPMSNEFSPSSNIATPGQPGGGGHQSPDGLFCHNKQLSKRGDEPNLMPVPSPQHIQYLNTFDGQELTIQKQPNTGLKDSSSSTTTTTSTMSPSISSSQNNMEMILTDSNMKNSQANTPSNHHSPSSMDIPVGTSRYPGTPSDFASPSPSAMESNNGPPNKQGMQQMRNGGYTCPPSPQQPLMNDSRYPSSYGNGPQHKPGGMMVDPKDSPLGFPSRLGPGDMPLNPSAAAAAAAAAGLQTSQQQPMKHFDPISSLAQMNQQLANNVAGGGSSPIVNHGSGVPSLHHSGGPGHHHPGGGMISPFGGGGGPPMHMIGGNNDPMCGPMGIGSGGMHDSGMGAPSGNNGRMMYGPGSGPPSSGPNGSGMSMGPGGGMPIGISSISGGRNGNMMMNTCVSGGPLSPKSSSIMQQQQYQQQQQQRLMPRITGGGGPGVPPYNGGANIQVKPSAPNTIQYLPNNSRGGGPRGPLPPPQNQQQQQQQQQQPSLDFLQRFSGGPGSGGNQLSNLDGKVPSHNLQYFPNSGGGSYNNSNGGPGINDIMCGNSGPPGGSMGGMPPGGPNSNRGMMRGGPTGMVRLGHNNSGMGMSGGNYNGGNTDSIFGGGGGGGGGPLHHPSGGHSQQQQLMMMGSGPGGPPPQQHKGGGILGGPGPPDATQPLPPSMGGGGGPGPGGGPGGFRGGPPSANSFIGPTTADPNYAQQFHNFQQQLYATNTRGGGGGPSGPGGGGPQQFFVSK